MNKFIGFGATEIAQRIASGEVSACEVIEAHIARIEAVNPKLNAVIIPLFEQAKKDAIAADEAHQVGETLGELHGVPITIKASFDVVGTISTMGVAGEPQMKATQDAVMVERLRRSGAIILGKTNIPQLAALNQTDNPVYGRTVNPWNSNRAPGGSTGGEAAIIAAGGSCLGLGSDFGGSVRMPAHACGINSIKPTSRRLTLSGHASFLPGQSVIISQPGVLARRVPDLSLVMKILCAPGQEVLDYHIPPVAWREPETVQVENLRIAFYTDNNVMTPSPAIQRAVREAASALENYGAVVEEWTPNNLARAVQLFMQLTSADGYATFKKHVGNAQWNKQLKTYHQIASTPRGLLNGISSIAGLLGLEDMSRSLASIGKISVTKYWEVTKEKDDFCTEFLAAMNRNQYDAIICPSNALPALTHGDGFFVSEDTTYTCLYNLLGMPAGVVAATRVREGEESERNPKKSQIEAAASKIEQGSLGLPIGVQVVARHWREDIVLAVMSILEQHFRAQPDYPSMI
ncbi:amidase [Aetokthonos hydrillicola Thurmond2011]|jgi:fatty acid amide hydrolase|uniref:Amidase n=1 Tax=Aetokthonos hydrillicola Thurmond2011 TaxID=2712845 RepID=A0AAP5IG95_9CYAN|nr:amidase family protein [Aetokthonos hydrillicola]MBO3457893.1 amidase [Aetokthonos hydrillicola CCALA 1050]MBW4587380.1 amidase [Aetokthonos hydrillicola CCALA 1050]MDR9899949.1 amidase [Aetokthonos hydrillicola Thurmond2011]